MLCERCHKNEANIHTRQSINGVTKEHHLCNNCAKSMQDGGEWSKDFFSIPQLLGSQSFFDNSPFDSMSMGQLFQDFFSAPTTQGMPGKSQQPVLPTPCPSCGMSWSEFQKNGLLGCGECYDHFGNLMPELLRRLHGNTEHIGKVPQEGEAHLAQKNKLDELRSRLNEAVAAEDFEKACELRDEIRDLSEKNNNEEEENDA